MRPTRLLFAVSLFVFSASALAYHCPKDMAEIDAALAADTSLSPAERDEVSRLRAEGEALHNSGRHQESVDTLARAMQMLGTN